MVFTQKMYSSAARTNLSSQCVTIDYQVIGEGKFRTAYSGTYIGGNRNQQAAVCKCFKGHFRALENEYFASDFMIADKAIQYAEEWNRICAGNEKILITRGDVHTIAGTQYMVEPLIRNFTKFTSNNGWISDENGWEDEAMAAFTHFTYHRSGGHLIVCDLQGRYRDNSRFGNNSKSRFELTDVAICSRNRSYGPTDLGEKGINSFFHNYSRNQFSDMDGRWQMPRQTRQWFPKSSSTSMMRSSDAHLLSLNYQSTFRPGFDGILEEDYDSSDSYDY